MDAIAGLDEEGFRARPQAGAWSVAEVLTHLLIDEDKLSDGARTALDADDSAVDGTADQQHDENAREAARRMAVPQIIHGLLAQRRGTLADVEGLSSDELVGHVAQLFQHIADHESEHAAQVRALRKPVA